jgi:hypothetical protein
MGAVHKTKLTVTSLGVYATAKTERNQTEVHDEVLGFLWPKH